MNKQRCIKCNSEDYHIYSNGFEFCFNCKFKIEPPKGAREVFPLNKNLKENNWKLSGNKIIKNKSRFFKGLKQ